MSPASSRCHWPPSPGSRSACRVPRPDRSPASNCPAPACNPAGDKPVAVPGRSGLLHKPALNQRVALLERVLRGGRAGDRFAVAQPRVAEVGFLVRVFFFFQAEDGIRDGTVTGVQTCALPI